MATYAIGDLQGCMTPLRLLLQQMEFDPQKDRLWIVGDLVNRGPESLSVLRFVHGLGKAAVTVLGNHDIHLLAVAAGVTPLRPKDTFQDILNAPDRETLLTWLRHCPLLHRTDTHTLIHAGLLPQWSIDHAERLAQEVEQMLQDESYGEFLRSLYEGHIPNAWSPDLRGIIRLGVTVNALTKLRVCSSDGRMHLAFKGELQDIPQGYFPWFQVPGRLNAEATVVFGHWSALGVHFQDNVMAIDSGCVWGRVLTAVRLEDRQVFQIPCRR